MVETEKSFTYAEFRDAFTRKWNLYQGRKVDTPVIIGGDSNGTHFFWEDERGDRHYGVISDLFVVSLIAGFDQTLTTYQTSQGIVSNSTNRKIAVQFVTGATNVVALAAGSLLTAQIKDSTGLAITADGAGGLQVIPNKFDGANNAYTQTATGVAVATQLITSGTLYRKLSIKNIGANPALLGFDNLVNAGNGYLLTALTGTSDEKIYEGFNANLWAFSTLGTTLSIEGRG